MNDKAILKTGLVGTAVGAVCCFTPALVIVLGAFGVAGAIGWLDYMLLPAMGGFIGMTGYGLWRRKRSS